MLDKSKPYDIAGMGNRTCYKQDGVYYDPSSGKEVDLSSKPPAPPVKALGLTCKLCGAVRQNAVLMKEHLLAVHKDEVGELQPEPEPNLAGMSIPKLREYAKKHKIELSKLTRKADILEAIQKAEAPGDNG